MTKILKGALHVHSTYSDGEFTMSELRQIFQDDGCDFVCMSDHAEYFDSAKLQAYHAECRALSTPQFAFVPGLEYECERRMHILGYGAKALANSQDPQTVIRHIQDQGALAVIAHPKDEFFPWIEEFATVPQGIEVWNSKYDGRYAPRPQTFALLNRLRLRSPAMLGFYGQDLHWKKQFRGLFVELECEQAQPDQILTALAHGSYTGMKADLRLSSSGVLQPEMLAQFSEVHQKSHRMRILLKDSKKMLDRLGITIPASLKAQIRRIF